MKSAPAASAHLATGAFDVVASIMRVGVVATVIVSLLAVFALLAPCLMSTSIGCGSAVIHVRVLIRDRNGLPVEGAQVTLDEQYRRTEREYKSNRQGEVYATKGVGAGFETRYCMTTTHVSLQELVLEVSAAGFETQSLFVSSILGERSTQQEFTIPIVLNKVQGPVTTRFSSLHDH